MELYNGSDRTEQLWLIRGCALGPLEASALGDKTPALNGKVR